MLKNRFAIAAATALVMSLGLIASTPAANAAGGCGPDAWRGPYGHCRDTPFYGRLPDGEWKLPGRVVDNGCPPGYWRGPWGHCRNTPFHGRLPDGEWK